MRLVEFIKENENIPQRFEINLPVVYKDNLFRLFRKMGIGLLKDSQGPNNSWSFVIDNKFNKDVDSITDIIRNNLKYQGRMDIRAI